MNANAICTGHLFEAFMRLFNFLTSFSGGSIGSELNCAATIEACKRLRTRMDVVMRMLPQGQNDWIAQCTAGGQAALDMTGPLSYSQNLSIFNSWHRALLECALHSQPAIQVLELKRKVCTFQTPNSFFSGTILFVLAPVKSNLMF